MGLMSKLLVTNVRGKYPRETEVGLQCRHCPKYNNTSELYRPFTGSSCGTLVIAETYERQGQALEECGDSFYIGPTYPEPLLELARETFCNSHQVYDQLHLQPNNKIIGKLRMSRLC